MSGEKNDAEQLFVEETSKSKKLLLISLILAIAAIILFYAFYSGQFEKIDDSYSNIDYLQDIIVLSRHVDSMPISESEKFAYKRELDALKQEAYNPNRKNRKHKTDAFFKKFGLEREISDESLND